MLQLRRAGPDDADALLRWRNDPATRAASHSDAVLVPGQHAAWLAAVLADPQRRLWIAETASGESIGAIRADRAEEGYLLSWMLAPEARGKGFGKALLAAAMAELPDVLLRAEIKDDNVASWRMAEACGFQCVKNEDGLRHYLR